MAEQMTQTFTMLPVAALTESPMNPRKIVAKVAEKELAASVKAQGVLQPILVRPKGEGFEIVVGSRRYRAAKTAKLTEIPAVVRELTDQEVLEIQVVENLQRADIHPLDEAVGFQQLAVNGLDVEAMATRVGKTPAYVHQRMKLTALREELRKAYLDGKLALGHAMLLCRLQPDDQARAFTENLHESWDGQERRKALGPVVELARWIDRTLMLDLHKAPWKKDDATLVPEAGPCTTCPKRTGNAPTLFPEVEKTDTCTDAACYDRKAAAFAGRVVAEVQAKAKQTGKVVELSTRPTWKGTAPRGLADDKWHPAVKGCPNAIKGVVVDGDGVGQVKTVCLLERCPVCRRLDTSTRSSGNYAAEERKRLKRIRKEAAFRTRVLAAVLAKTTSLDRPALERVALGFFNDVWQEYRKRVARLFGWTKQSGMVEAWAKGRVPKLSAPDLSRFLLAMALAKYTQPSSHGADRSEPKVLFEAAKRLKVNVAKLRRDSEAVLPVEEEDEEPRPTRKPTKRK